jgi:hypothetical protein
VNPYRCYFFDSFSQLIAASAFHCRDGAEALREARRELAAHERGAAAEIWHEGGYLGFVLRSDAVEAAIELPPDRDMPDRHAGFPSTRRAKGAEPYPSSDGRGGFRK